MVSEIRLDEYCLRDRRVNSLLITQTITPKRPKNVIKRMARILIFLPENAYVRSIRMTEYITDTDVNNSIYNAVT